MNLEASVEPPSFATSPTINKERKPLAEDCHQPRMLKSHHKTIVQALEGNAKHHPAHVLIEWVNNKCEVESGITYAKLWQQSGPVASLLQQNGVKRGDRVMIAYPFGLEFLSGIFGCMRIGVIPCSVRPPCQQSTLVAYLYSHPTVTC